MQRVKWLAQEDNALFLQPWLKPGPFDPESGTLIMLTKTPPVFCYIILSGILQEF